MSTSQWQWCWRIQCQLQWQCYSLVQAPPGLPRALQGSEELAISMTMLLPQPLTMLLAHPMSIKTTMTMLPSGRQGPPPRHSRHACVRKKVKRKETFLRGIPLKNVSFRLALHMKGWRLGVKGWGEGLKIMFFFFTISGFQVEDKKFGRGSSMLGYRPRELFSSRFL